MAFEKINIDKLKNSLRECEKNFDTTCTRNLINGNLDNSFKCDSKVKLKNALLELRDERYQDLKKMINRYQKVCEDIEEYKKLQMEVLNLKERYNNLSVSQYYEETYQEQVINDDGKYITETKTRTVQDYYVTSQMNEISNTIDRNKEKMQTLYYKVRESV